MEPFRLPSDTHLGPVTLQVSDLERALGFYRDLLGMREIRNGDGTCGLSSNGTAPALLVLSEREGARPKPHGTTGLYHVAIRLPERYWLGKVIERLYTNQYPLQGAADHGVSEALYLSDMDGNGLEIYADRPWNLWSNNQGIIHMVTEPLNVRGLREEASAHPGEWNGLPEGTDVGHIHLQVSDLGQAEKYYSEVLGFDVTQRGYSGALFFSAGKYHHHIGTNTWTSQNGRPPPEEAVGLLVYTIVVPDRQVILILYKRLEEAGISVLEKEAEDGGEYLLTSDYDEIRIEITTE